MTYREFCLALKDILGKEDYQWLMEFTEKDREKKTKEAENNFEIEKINKLKEMPTEDYLFHALSDPDFENKLRQSGLAERDVERIRIIVAKLRFQKVWRDNTSI